MEDLTGIQLSSYQVIAPLEDGYYRLTNQFLGEGRSLDTSGEGEALMGLTGDYSGQDWKLTPVK